MRKKLLVLVSVGIIGIGLSSCTTIDKFKKDVESKTKGLHRVVKVYADNGELISEYEDENMLVTDGDGGTIQIDFQGKRITFCNVSVVIEELKGGK